MEYLGIRTSAVPNATLQAGTYPSDATSPTTNTNEAEDFYLGDYDIYLDYSCQVTLIHT
jgi:hypothetical protein